MEAFHYHGNQFSADLPQNILKSFPNPSQATHKILSILTNWLNFIPKAKELYFNSPEKLPLSLSTTGGQMMDHYSGELKYITFALGIQVAPFTGHSMKQITNNTV